MRLESLIGKIRRGVFRDERGITTAGMAVSMLVALCLMFSGAQLYRVQSASSEIQEVADACALAAENEVAEFMIAVNVCDATILSMTLLSATACGLGLVAACIPPVAPLSEELLTAAREAAQVRDSFADNAAEGLNRLQDLLPFLAAASAANVAQANNSGAMPANYYAVGVLVSSEGKTIGSPVGSDLADATKASEQEGSNIRELAKQAEEAANTANEAKKAAYAADCGNNPGYCQYERAGRFSWMPESDNPYFSNIDSWSFSVALDRACKYYYWRLQKEAEPSGSVADKASFHIRQKFYKYAYEELSSKGYVRDDGGSFSANFPKLFGNLEEFRQSRLYAEAEFPISEGSGEVAATMHAYAGCPAASNIIGYANVIGLEDGAYDGCPVCGFSILSIAEVADASRNISNGFEYHYEAIRKAAEEYQSAREALKPLSDEVKGKTSPLMKALEKIMSEIGSKRIEADPPGSKGAIAIVVNLSHNNADTGFENLFVSGGTLGVRAAVSGATLVEDASDDNSSVITSLLDGLGDGGGAAVGSARILLDLWSSLLRAYEDGGAAVKEALSRGLGSVPINTASGLGKWAAEAFEKSVNAAGLEPANLNAQKPAILNTGHIASSDSGAFATTFSQVKSNALSFSSPSSDVFTGLASRAASSVKGRIADTTITVAEISFPGVGGSIPIKVSLPPAIQEGASGLVDQAFNAVSGAISAVTGERAWQ